MLVEILRKKALENNFKEIDKEKIKEIINHLNKDKIIIVSGIMFGGKEEIISQIIKKTNIGDNFFYFNKSIDYKNEIKNFNDCKSLLKKSENIYGKAKIVFLEEINNFNGLKEFIKYLYENRIKTIIISNSIKIPGIKSIEINSHININTINHNLAETLNYGFIGKNDKEVNLIKNSILLNDIYNNYSIRDTDILNYTLSYISEIGHFVSQRQILNELKNNRKIKISHITLNEYINHSINSRLIKYIVNYDLKRDIENIVYSKYFFTDLGIRNSFNNFSTDNYFLVENLIFLIYYKLGFNIYGGINGTFNFNFIIFKNDKIKYYIHISKQTSTKEIKKEIKKLLKIGDNIAKFLIIDKLANGRFSINDLLIKKKIYDSVKIVSLEEFIRDTI